MNHKHLVLAAAGWLAKQKHSIIITEMASVGFERPDAIGWRCPGVSTLVECKASRSDFYADAKKPFRLHPQKGIGAYRYYLSLPGVIMPEMLPENWGLIELTGSKVRVIREAIILSEWNKMVEIGILMSAMRRMKGALVEGISANFYSFETKRSCTVGVAIDQDPFTRAPDVVELKR